MKKILLGCFAILFLHTVDAATINVLNNMTPYDNGSTTLQIVAVADTANITGNYSSWNSIVVSSSSAASFPSNNLFYYGLKQEYTSGSTYPYAALGYKLYLDNGNQSYSTDPYLGYLDITYYGNSTDANGYVGGVTFSPSGMSSNYSWAQEPSVNHIVGSEYAISGTLAGEPLPLGEFIITNALWNNGMGNSDSSFVAGDSFWTQDYGINEVGRWTVDQTDSAIEQSTDEIDNDGNYGSRAYPTIQNADGTYLAGTGDAYSGVWQVDMQIGSNGAGPFCETFYLAERDNLTPGPENYLDGSGTASGGNSREIDIMETQWQPSGPQVDLPNGGGTSWNASEYQSVLMQQWANDGVGGAPMTTGFVTFGAYINGTSLWLYAYLSDGTLWYSTPAIPLNNSTYVQQGPFVPYIGTWTSGTVPGGFVTKYKNFIYLPSTSIPAGVDPYETPSEFWSAVTGS